MRKLLFFILLGIIFNNFSYAQWWKHAEVELILKNGDTLNGYGKLDAWKFNYKSLENKKTKIDYNNIDKAVFKIFLDSKKTEYEYITLYKLDIEKVDPTLFQPMYTMAERIYKNDKVTIFATRFVPKVNVTYKNSGLPKNFKATRTYGYDSYYCKVKNEENLRLIYTSISFKSFNKLASKCFEDCLPLSKKIENDEFKLKDLFKIADYYTNSCN